MRSPFGPAREIRQGRLRIGKPFGMRQSNFSSRGRRPVDRAERQEDRKTKLRETFLVKFDLAQSHSEFNCQYYFMSKYRVSIFKTLLSSDGHPFKCLQFMIDIASARSTQRAIEAARCRYERKVRIPSWKSIADIIEANELETSVSRRGRVIRRPAYTSRRAPPSLPAPTQSHGCHRN